VLLLFFLHIFPIKSPVNTTIVRVIRRRLEFNPKVTSACILKEHWSREITFWFGNNVDYKYKNWLNRRNVCRCNSQGRTTRGVDEQADDISRDADDTASRRRGRPPGRLLSYDRGNGRTVWRSNSRRHVRRALSRWRERPEILRVLLQARRCRQAVQVRRSEIQQPVHMRTKAFVYVRYHQESWIEGIITNSTLILNVESLIHTMDLKIF